MQTHKMEIVLNPKISNWRLDQGTDEQLKKDLKKGQLQNIIVRHLSNGKYELVGGHRRYKELVALGKTPEEMDIKILENVSDQEAVMMAYMENRLRRNLSDIEEGRAFRTMTELPMTIDDIAVRAGRNKEYVQVRLNLLKLPSKIQEKIEEGKIPMSFGKPLLLLKDEPKIQLELAHKIASHDYEVKNVDDAEALAQRYLESVEKQKQVSKQYGPCPKCSSDYINFDPYEYGEDHNKKMKCGQCGYAWHRETKEPWDIFELKRNAQKLGLKLTVKNGDAIMTPADMQTILQDQAAKLKALELGNFRTMHTIGELLLPLVQNDQLLRFRIEGDKIEVKLIENTGLHFSARRHDYQSGEHTQIKAERNYYDEDHSNSAERNIEAVRKFVDTLAPD